MQRSPHGVGPMNFETRPSLFERLRNGDDPVAWREFDERYRDLILAFCRSRGVQPCDAEDVHQLVMIGFSRALPRFHYDPARGRFRSYLGRAVRHAIERHLHRASHDGVVADGRPMVGPEAEVDPAPDEEWEREWMQHHFRLAMKTVRSTVEPRSLDVFGHLLAGRSVEETAKELDMSEPAVHKIKQRVRDRLKALIADQVAEEDGLRG